MTEPTPRPTIYKMPSKNLPRKPASEQDKRLWEKNKKKHGIK
jgi:hypothetical protein